MVKKFIFFVVSVLSTLQFAVAAPTLGSFSTSDGQTIRTAKWEAKSSKRGTLFFLQGMGGFIEGYTDFAQEMNDLGFDVFTLDWRGQGGSSRITTKESLLHIHSFDDYVRDLEGYFSQQKEFARPIIVVGNSMGGHIALRYIYSHPNAIDGLIALSPMVDVNTNKYPYFLARALAKTLRTLGGSEKFVFGFKSFDLDKCISSFDPDKYGDRGKYISDCVFLNDHKNLATAGPSFAWLAAAFDSCDKIRDYDFASRILIPVLMVTVPKDHLVDADAQRELCAIIPKCRQILYQDGHHNLLKDRDEVIDRLVHDIDRFTKDLPSLQKGIPQSVLVMNHTD
jgi:lysophospholipase